MAAKSSIAIRRNTALQNITRLLGEGFILPTQGRDPDLLYAVQLEAIAAFLECKAAETSITMLEAVEPELTALEAMRDMEPAKPQNKRRTGKK